MVYCISVFGSITIGSKWLVFNDHGGSVKCNKGARGVLSTYFDIIINDLYTFTLPHHEGWMSEPGNVYYNTTGFQAQAEAFARVINQHLYMNL